MNASVDALFTPVNFAGLSLKNRVAMAPMTRSLCGAAGIPGEANAHYYAARAAAGTGLIITEGTVVDMGEAHGYAGVPGLCNDAQEAGWRQVVDAVHAAGGKIAVQLWHCGRLSHSRATGGLQPIAPSAIAAKGVYIDAMDPSTHGGDIPYELPRAMTAGDIERVTGEFAQAAARARNAGFDAIELHGAHGYLISTFFNAESNQRQDGYGGSVVARTAFAKQIIAACKAAVQQQIPVGIRLSQFAVDDFEWITWPDEAELETTLTLLREAGADFFHASAHRLRKPAWPGAAESFAQLVHRLGRLPTIAVGGVTYTAQFGESFAGAETELSDPAEAAAFLSEGHCDLVAVGRGLIANPDWTEKVRSGRWQDLRPFHVSMLPQLV